ncbi:16S rRNA (adenine(1518)-N(6)/adenine(1519)-N(6))-dimethyltransferase RsmA [Halieaceae bacterium IMCC14734]|uniref:Ribosomal RNA small subunit methyltransferase A n=1 Tax=Candidatus Litorirhabdus singularis TaxID=2518993 RepID=A0ABT3TM75_9GAMM|nr:16S rRNA (adenine(1518)-N(6)/adenine(1519)-N(6))-dimethyltransferase RsmA [Candidatus Litorirhabdus singularis]MCX2983361.1 16S rRNA (adenine(1518)-N(6)/adenine(1519)-N(6))-dimethyltransferase RsmA [Candidatus Litorirhabdus singularis]
MSDKHRARKRFGQNFLTDAGVIRQIARAINPRPDQHVVEIGPGKGALTTELVDSAGQLDVIELDRDLVPLLQQRFANADNLTVHSADALSFDYAQLQQAQQPLRVVGNLPYNISTPLIFHLLQYVGLITDMHFMLQLEVVKRLSASPGSKAWGKLGVMAQYHCQVDSLFEVPPHAFSPAPKVQSAIVRLQPKPAGSTDAITEARLRRVVSTAFAQRRKTLRNTLRDLVSVQQLESVGIEPGARAETLSLDQFLAISALLEPND